MSVEFEDIKRLRKLTGAGITDAKQALEASQGDFDKALKRNAPKGLNKSRKTERT